MPDPQPDPQPDLQPDPRLSRTGVTDAHPDPAFPRLHARPARGWLNDPNGVGRVDDRYHLFFQHNPASARHDAIVWGHVSSTDLLHWREEPVAVAPRVDGPDESGCWSGCLVDDAGVPTLVYSGMTAIGGASEVVLARSDRTLRAWTRDEPTAVGMPDDPTVTDVRDPFCFTFEGRRWAVQGAGARGGPARVLLYDASDLTAWRECGDLLDPQDPLATEVAPADIWECPNLLPVAGRWLLLLSLWRGVGEDGHELAGVRHLLGDLVAGPDGCPRFEPTSGGLVDEGPAFYAPQAFLDGTASAGRVLLWGWSWEHGRGEEESDAAGWAGVLTFPREVRCAGDELVVAPAAELAVLRGSSLDATAPLEARAFEVEAAGSGPAALVLQHADGSSVQVVAWGLTAAPSRVLVDGSLVEAFPAGTLPHTTRGYPRAGSRWRVEAPGATTLRAWELTLG